MIRRSKKYSMIGGVCAGYALSERKPIALVRIFAVLLLLCSAGLAAIIYLCAWIFMPGAGEADWEVLSPDDKLLVKRPENKVIGGVCGAFADYFKVDATLIRFITVVLFFAGGIGFFTYVFAWAVIPEVSSLPQGA